MRRGLTYLTLGLMAAVAAWSAADARTSCESYAHDRKVTGTVIGALGGGLLGSAVAGHGSKGEGALVGAGLGAVVGNNVSRVSCDNRYTVRRTRYRAARTVTPTEATPTYAYGRAPAYAAGPAYASNTRVSCRYVTRPYYDQAGRLMYAPMQICE